MRKSNPTTNEVTGTTRYEQIAYERRILNRGDSIRVLLPGKTTRKKVTFLGWVEPNYGAPFVEVEEEPGRIRCISLDAIHSKVRGPRTVTA